MYCTHLHVNLSWPGLEKNIGVLETRFQSFSFTQNHRNIDELIFILAAQQSGCHQKYHQEEHCKVADAINERNQNPEGTNRITAWKRCQIVRLQRNTDIRVARHGGECHLILENVHYPCRPN